MEMFTIWPDAKRWVESASRVRLLYIIYIKFWFQFSAALCEFTLSLLVQAQGDAILARRHRQTMRDHGEFRVTFPEMGSYKWQYWSFRLK